MRAWQVKELGEPQDGMELAEVNAPSAKEGQVIIDVEAVSLGFPDLLQVRGGYQVKPPMPFTPGTEIAGTVSAVGEGVTDRAVGDRVVWMGAGGLAEQVAAPSFMCFPLPDNMTSPQAACLPLNYGTGIFALDDRGHLKEGQTLLVTAAAGGAGSAAVQLGKAMGARVIGMAGGPAKCQAVLDLGADLAIDYTSEDIVSSVKEATEGKGVDVCYEAVGGDTFDAVRRVIAWDGRLLVIGFTSGRIPDAPANHILLKNYDIVGVHWGARLGRDPEALKKDWDRISDLFATGHLDPLINAVRPLDEAVEALNALGSRKTVGKVVIDPRL